MFDIRLLFPKKRLGHILWFYMCMLHCLMLDSFLTSSNNFIERILFLVPVYTLYAIFLVLSWQFLHLFVSVRTTYVYMVIVASLVSGFVVFVMNGAPILEGTGRVFFLLSCTGAFYYILYLRFLAIMPIRQSVLLSSLQQKLKPHFLFNSINTVLGVVRDDPRMAERLLEDLSELFRNLAVDDRVVYSFKEDLDITNRYLDIENIRTGDNINIQLEIEESTLSINVPFLLLQPLIENAIHYGNVDKRKNGHLRVVSRKTSNGILIILENSVSEAGDLKKGAGTTLRNIKKRLSLMYDVDAFIDMNTTKGLFRLQIRIPDSCSWSMEH